MDNKYDNINDQFNDFHWRLDECINRHAPIKKLSPGEIKLKCKPWINNKIMKLIKVRNKLRQPNNAGVVNFLKSSEIELIERLLNQKKIILQIILLIVPITYRKHGKLLE